MIMPKPIIFDCDPGIDDALALLLAFASDRLDIRAVTVVGGNQELEETLNNAIGLISFLGREAVVSAGAPGPLLRPLVTAPEVHGEAGLAGIILPRAFKANDKNAVELMRHVTEYASEPVGIIATGPLTNVAAFLAAYPLLKKKISGITMMGGACFGGNQSPAAEFNIYVDPEAASVVFRSGVPIVMCGLDVTTRAFFTENDIEWMRGMNTRVSRFVVEILDFYMDFHRGIGLSVVNMHDLCAVAYELQPRLFSVEACHVEVETRGELTRGCTVVDKNGMTGLAPNAGVVFDVDREAFVRLFADAVLSFN